MDRFPAALFCLCGSAFAAGWKKTQKKQTNKISQCLMHVCQSPEPPKEWCQFECRIQATYFKSWRNFSGHDARTRVARGAKRSAESRRLVLWSWFGAANGLREKPPNRTQINSFALFFHPSSSETRSHDHICREQSLSFSKDALD